MAKPEEDKLRAEWFWCDRWAQSSAKALSIAHRGLYREMLTAAWLLGARLPNDHADIRRLVGVDVKEWRALWPKVEPYWRVDGAWLINDTQVEIYAEAQRRNHIASQRGKAGASARWKREDGASTPRADARVDAQASPEQWPQSQSLIRSSTPSESQTDARAAAPVGPERPRRPNPYAHAQVQAPNGRAFWEGPIFSIPDGWARKTLAAANGHAAGSTIVLFAKALTERLQRDGGEAPTQGFLGWLDVEWTAYRAGTATVVSSGKAISATQAMLDGLRERSLAAVGERARG